jgi:hypothetical protein
MDYVMDDPVSSPAIGGTAPSAAQLHGLAPFQSPRLQVPADPESLQVD